MLMRDERIQKEIDAYALALEAEKHRSPAALRSLVIQALTQVLIDPDTKPAVRINAAKVLGTVTEVAAFTEQKVVRTISSSDDARARVMQELRGLLTAGATDATVIDADSLLAELDGSALESGEPEAQTPPHPDPPEA
jgi:glutamate/tyrosine decarboxylase-like PLP-dependent enzyme